MADIKITENDVLIVDGTTANNSSSQITQDVELLIDEMVVDTQNTTIGGNADKRNQLAWVTSFGDAGTYTAKIQSKDDSSKTFTVEVTVASGSSKKIEGFEDNDIKINASKWSGWSGDTGKFKSQSSTVLSESYSGQLVGVDNYAQVNISRSPGIATERVECLIQTDTQSGDNDDYPAIVSIKGDGGLISRAMLAGDGDIISRNNIGDWQKNKTYRIIFKNIDYANENLTIRAETASGSFLDETNSKFRNSASTLDSIVFQSDKGTTSGSANAYIDDIMVQQ